VLVVLADFGCWSAVGPLMGARHYAGLVAVVEFIAALPEGEKAKDIGQPSASIAQRPFSLNDTTLNYTL
jgi:hypothetical protein